MREDNDMNHQLPILPRPVGLLEIIVGLPLALSLTACDGLSHFLAKAEPRQEETVVATPPPEKKEAQETPDDSIKLKPSPLYEWNGKGRMVSRIVVDTDAQKARFYAGEEEVGWSTVATGISKYPTPTGQFKVIEKVENKRSNLYGKVYGKGGQVISSSVKVGRDPIPAGARFEGSQMPYFLRLTHDGVGLHAGPIPRPGKPASHGCIRMPRQFAPVLFSHVSNGTEVKIVGSGPDYGNYVEKQRAIAAAQAAEQRRQAAKRAEEAASKAAQAQVAAASRPAPAVRPQEVAAPAQATAQVVPGKVIEAHAEAKDSTGIGAASTPATNGETRLISAPASTPTATAKTETAADTAAAKQGMPLPSQLPSAAPVAATTPPAAAQAPATPTPPTAQGTAPVAPTAPKAPEAPKPEPVVAATTPPPAAAPATPSAPPATPPAAKPEPPPSPPAAQPSAPDDKAG